jgi:photosystem II stability/assembly factor-like uncharacterized protein
MRILAFLILFQSFVACQQGQETASNIVLASSVASQQAPEKAPPSVTDIIYKSTDGGKTWQDISAGLPEKSVWNVYADKDQLFLIADKGVYRNNTPSATVPVWEKEYLLDNRIISFFPGKAGTYAYSDWNNFYQAVSGTGLWKSVYPSLKLKIIRSILETPDGAILAGSDKGILKSTDGGNTWKEVYTGNMVVSLNAADGVLLGGADQGVLISTDGGEHWDWSLKGDGMTQKTAAIDGRLVAITRSTREEGPWQQVNNNADNMVNCLYTSTDKGKTWQRMGENIPGILEIEDVEQVGKYLFCSCDTGIFRSADWGKTWELMRSLPNSEKRKIDLAGSGQVLYAAIVIKGGC